MRMSHTKKIITCCCILSITILYSAIALAATYDQRISQQTDDIEEKSNGQISMSSSDLDLAEKKIGLRFQNINIPPGATINSAYIYFQEKNGNWNYDTFTIYGEDSGNAPSFANNDNFITDKVANNATTASVSWHFDAGYRWNLTDWYWWYKNAEHPTTNIKSIIAEIIARPDWASGNAMAFFLTGGSSYKYELYSYDKSSSRCPRLVIDYTPVVGPKISLNKTAINSTFVSGTNAPDDTFTISNSGVGTFNYTITSSQPSWITSFSPSAAAGIDPSSDIDTITVGYSTAALSPGTYTATITVSSPDTLPTLETIDVTMQVTGTPVIVQSPSIISTTVGQNTINTSSYSFNISNTGTDTLNYIISDNAAWLGLSSTSGSLANDGSKDTIILNIDTSGLAAGSNYHATITIASTSPTASNTPQTIIVTLFVSYKITVSVSQSTDDAEELNNSGGIYLYNWDLDMVYDSYRGGVQTVGIKFNNINLPAGSLVTNAYIQFESASNKSSTIDLSISGQADTSPATFNYTYYGISNRPRTTATVNWINVENWSSHAVYNTANIAAIVQEIISLPTWAPNNSMAFIIEGNSEARNGYSYDGSGASPKLVIEYTPVSAPIISVSPPGQLGVTSNEGINAADTTFTLSNTGSVDLNYIITDDQSWMACSPTSGIIAPGASHTITVGFNSAAMVAATYSATVTISDPNAYNHPYNYTINLQIDPMVTGSICGDVPIYAQNIINPAILILLDVSGSMVSLTDTNTSVANPQTPNLKNITQQMVNQANWTANISDMVFIITGEGNRTALPYDDTPANAPKIFIEYYTTDPALTTIFERQISQSSDDAEQSMTSGSVSLTSTTLQLVQSGSTNQTIGLRFQNINVPQNARITNTYIEFSKDVTTSDPTNLLIRGEDSSGTANHQPPTFSSTANNISSRTLLNNVVSWSFIDTWWGVTRMSRYKVGTNVISDLVTDRSISWGFGTWTGNYNGPNWYTGPNTSNLITNYSKVSKYYTYNPYFDEYSGGADPNLFDLWTRIVEPVKSRTASETVAMQNTILATTVGGVTPLAPSMLAARGYFKGQKPDTGGVFYNSNLTCQPKFLIEITDGLGQSQHTTDNWMTYYTNWLADSKITSVAIGFDLTNSSQIDALARTSNIRGAASATDQLYALHEDRDNDGDIDAFSAASGAELQAALQTITSSVKAQLYYGSAPAPATSVDLGNFVISATFNPAGWGGDIKALPYNPDTGALEVSDPMLPDPTIDCLSTSSTCWRAGAPGVMPADKNDRAFTVAGPLTTPMGTGIPPAINYTDATLPSDNYICKDIGDIIHSTPRVIASPSKFHNFDHYRLFKLNSEVSSRPPLVAVGSNDGALHFLNLETGAESHRFYPLGAQSTLNSAAINSSYDMCDNDNYCHHYTVDGSPIATDIFINTDSVTYTDISKTTIVDSAWRTLLVCGLGDGGNSYFAIDTTYNSSFDAVSNPSSYLWNYTDSELGTAISKPLISRVNNSSLDPTFGGWGLFLGSGYSTTNQTTKEAYLYGLKAWDKSQLWFSSEKVKLEEDNTIDFNLQSADFNIGETITGSTSNATALITAIVDDGTTGSLKLSGISGIFLDSEIINSTGGGTGSASVTGTIHTAYQDDALSTPITVDIEFDDVDDFIYTGSLHGRMFRVENIGMGETPLVTPIFDFGEKKLNFANITNSFTKGAILSGTSGASGKIVDIDTTANQLSLVNLNGISFVSGETISDNATGTATANGTIYRDIIPIRAEADFSYSQTQNTIWLYFGTGRYESQVDKYTYNQMYFAGIKDDNLPATPLTPHLSDLIELSQVISVSAPTYRGVSGTNSAKQPWYMKLNTTASNPSERVITAPLVAGGIVFFQTFEPDSDPCGGNGDTWLYALAYDSGLAPNYSVFDTNGDGLFDDNDKIDFNDGNGPVVVTGLYVGRGTPTGLVYEGGLIFAGTTEAAPTGTKVNLPDLKAKLKSWHHTNF